MGKNNRHQKNLKSEKAKVKLKAKKLPKGQNITDTTFKVKKILIREQLKSHEESEIVSRRKLNVKDLLTRLQHHNSTVRQEAIRELKEIIQHYPMEVLSAHLSALLQGISSLTLDKEKDIRRDTLKVLNLILGPISNEQLAPFSDVLISYLCCAMTHIVPSIKEDSLNFLDVLVQNSSSLMAKHARKILPNFLDMISKHHSHSNTTRHLVVTLNSKNTSIKWRIKVLERLSSILTSVINNTKSRIHTHDSNPQSTREEILVVDDKQFYIPLYHGNYFDNCKINFDDDSTEAMEFKANVELDEFNKYIVVLMPLMMESWLEVKPKINPTTNDDPLISVEAGNLLKTITSVMQLIVEYLDVLEPQHDGPTGDSFRLNFQDIFAKYFLSNFPYSQVNSIERVRKRQADVETVEMNNSNNCLEQNLSLSYIYMWMISANLTKQINNTETIEFCERILEFINDKINNWSSSNAPALPLMSKLLRVIFLRSCKILYRSGVSLGSTLRSLIVASSRQPKRELHTQLFSILADIVLDHNLIEIHNEPAFKDFVKSLPDLLLKSSIYENTIKILNRVVLQYGSWIRDGLAQKQESILENAKIIQIIGTVDEKQSRLMICNLFHFMDGQIYF